MKREVIHPVYTLEELAEYEVISPLVSDKYVPIYTTEIAKILEPEFTLDHATRIQGKNSSHYADFLNEIGDRIRIYNSYDRSLAFRMSLVSNSKEKGAPGSYSVDLGTERVVHIGENATILVDKIRENKQDILNSVETARTILDKLSTLKINSLSAKIISEVVFNRLASLKGFQSYTNYADILIDRGISIDAYINISIKNYIDGNYTITSNGVKRKGRKSGSILSKVWTENKIVESLSEKLPELFL